MAPGPLEHEGEAGQHLPLVGLVGVEGQDGLAVVGRVVQRELEQRDVVVALLQGGRRREDHVGVASRLVDVDVDGHHALEAGDGGVEAGRVRGGQHGVAGDGDQRADLSLAGRVHLLGHDHGRELAEGLGQLAHTAGAAVEVDRPTEPRLAPGVAGAGGGRGEHGPAGAVEVAGEHVEHVHQPRREGAELGGGRADAAVDARGGRGGQLAGQPSDGVGLDAGGVGDGLRGERSRERR